ncbi:MAG: helix-turn-helix transcriptional regulator [Oligoflexales bacterium]|nr:helix-turn-helix transcriptional regulator [Oligoflexales bacterium]
MNSVKNTIKSWMSEDEIIQAEELSKMWILGVKTLRGSLSHTLHAEMEEKHLSYNEVARALGISENMVAKILYGKGSVNFDTIIRLTKLTGKVPYIAWKDPSEVKEKDLPLKKNA